MPGKIFRTSLLLLEHKWLTQKQLYIHLYYSLKLLVCKMKMNTYIKASFPSPNVLSSFMRANPLNRTCRIPWCKSDQFSHLFSFLDMAIKVSTILDKQRAVQQCSV